VTKVWLDDNRPAPEGWLWCRNVEEAALKLLMGPVDEMSLDFDLDQPVCPKCDFKCGYGEPTCKHACSCHNNGRMNGAALVDWMERSGRWPKKKPVVHSTSGRNAEEMKKHIDRAFPG
jgi:hypothetical protein